MADTGFILPGTAVGNRTVPSQDRVWSDPDNIKVDGAPPATVNLLTGETHSYGLAASNFDFSGIPSGADIDGIEVRIGYKRDAGTAGHLTQIASLILPDGSDGSEDKTSEIGAPTTSYVDYLAGGATDMWGEFLTRADLQDVDFGFFIGVRTNGTTSGLFSILEIKIKVYYHEGLPKVVSGVSGYAGHNPPYIHGGNVYQVVGFDTGVTLLELRMYKATDPTSSFTEQDSGNRPSNLIREFLVSSILDGDLIHVVWFYGGTTVYYYSAFDCSTDTWTSVDGGAGKLQTIDTIADPAQFPWCSIAVRSDGDVIVAYDGDTDRVMGGDKERVDYARREGGTWTAAIALDAAGDVHYGNPTTIKGPLTDDIHVFWQNSNATADPPIANFGSEARTIDPSNTLSAIDTSSTTMYDTYNVLMGTQTGVSWDDSGTQRMVFDGGMRDSLDNPRRYQTAVEDGSDDINLGGASFWSEDNAGEDIYKDDFGEFFVSSIAENGGIVYQLFAGGGARGVDQDIYYTKSDDNGDTWDMPTEELDAITCDHISANIYVRGGDTVMAYVYDDGGVQKYNEKVLISGAIHLPIYPKRHNTLLRM